MAKQEEPNYKSGTVVGLTTRYLPEKVKKIGKGTTVTEQHKIRAFVEIFVDYRTYTVPCPASTKFLETTEEPTNAAQLEVVNSLLEQHPIGSKRSFRETVNTKNKKHRLYTLDAVPPK